MISPNIEVDRENSRGGRFSKNGHAVSIAINAFEVKLSWQFVFVPATKIRIPDYLI